MTKMTESQIKEQENKQIQSLLIDEHLYSTNKSNKETSLNEIQNTLDDTVEINEKENTVCNFMCF
jgi:primosomal protein N''